MNYRQAEASYLEPQWDDEDVPQIASTTPEQTAAVYAEARQLLGIFDSRGLRPPQHTRGGIMYTAEFFRRQRKELQRAIPTWPEWKLQQFLSESYWEGEEAAGRLGCPWTYNFDLYKLAARRLDMLLGRSEEE